MNCPHCHATLVADARFCPACGNATSPTESGSNWAPASTTQDVIGREIAGRYRIVKKLGEGGMGAVYRGEQISLKRAVAVKLLRPELGSNQMVLRRFNAEAEAVAKLSHPNTVNIYDFGQDTDGALFIAMEFIEGRSLREAIQKEGPFSPTRAISIALQVAASLSDAHSHNIVHRDLKPDNVMLQDRGRHKDVVRVLDFGIAKLRDDSRQTQQAMTQAGDMLGTPQYMAPEQIRGEHIDGRTDVYALGCMIYEMVTARLPYEAPTIMAMLSKHLLENPVPPSQRRPDLRLPPSIDQLVLHAMAKEPAARPATMDQLGEMLQALLATLPADPNRSAGMSVQQNIATPVSPSSFQPPTFPPPPGAAPFAPSGAPPFASPPGAAAPTPVPASAFAPPSGAPPFAQPPSNAPTAPAFAPPAYAAPSTTTTAKRRAPIWIVLGLIALGGAGVGVYFATRDDKKSVTEEPDRPDPDEPTPDEPTPDEPTPDEPVKPTNPDDPWSGKDTPTTDDSWAPTPGAAVKAAAGKPSAPPAAASIGTDLTPIPAGAKLRVGSGFSSTVNDEAHLHINTARGITIALAPLFAGTNDPKKLAEMWTAQTGVTMTGSTKVPSAGKLRPALGFAGALPDGTLVSQLIVLYIEPGYRVGVLYQAPAANFRDKAFEREVATFFARNVVLP